MLNASQNIAGYCVLLCACLLASCGGGGGGSSPAPVQTPTLVSVALSPPTISLAAGGTAQLTVTGKYSDGSSQTLADSNETFKSSDTSVATVSSTGMLTVAAGATSGRTATITVTDVSGIGSAPAASTVVTVEGAGPPTATSESAATATATNNALCANVSGFYWEIGDKNGALASGSVGTDGQGNPLTADTKVSIASASKWVYGTYIVQVRGSAGALKAQDIDFLNFTSGYTNMSTSLITSDCPDPATGPNTVNVCLSQINPTNGRPYSYQDPNTIGKFYYNSGHLENHAAVYGGLGDTPNLQLGNTIAQELGTNISFIYTEPLLAGGIYTSALVYAQILRNILTGSLAMHDALGINPVCTQPSDPGCNAVFSPIPEAWHYSMAHWVEDDPSTNGDGAFSSAGALGFYPWIDASKTYYGIISRQAAQVGTGEQSGYASAQCGRLIRHAWMTGVEQKGQLPGS